MFYDFINLPNFVFGFGILILLLATCLLFISFAQTAWVGIALFAVYYWIIKYGGFPLSWIFLVKFPIELNGSKQSGWRNLVKLLTVDFLFIIQWTIWGAIFKSVF